MDETARQSIAERFIGESRKVLTAEHLPRIERCLERLTDEEIWWRPNDESNSVGNLVLHLSGNVRQWIVGGVGGGSQERDRQKEFDERGPVPRAELLSKLRATIADADRALAAVNPSTLLERRRIQGEDVDILEAVYHVVEHFSMHTGQIILLTKMRRGDLAFYDVSPEGTASPQWQTPSAPDQ